MRPPSRPLRRHQKADRNLVFHSDRASSRRNGPDAEVCLSHSGLAAGTEPIRREAHMHRHAQGPRDAVQCEVSGDAKCRAIGGLLHHGDPSGVKRDRRVFLNVEDAFTEHHLLHLGNVLRWFSLAGDLQGGRVEFSSDGRFAQIYAVQRDLSLHGGHGDLVIVPGERKDA